MQKHLPFKVGDTIRFEGFLDITIDEKLRKTSIETEGSPEPEKLNTLHIGQKLCFAISDIYYIFEALENGSKFSCQPGAIRFNSGVYRLTAITQDVNVARNSIGQTGYWLADIVQRPDNH